MKHLASCWRALLRLAHTANTVHFRKILSTVARAKGSIELCLSSEPKGLLQLRPAEKQRLHESRCKRSPRAELLRALLMAHLRRDLRRRLARKPEYHTFLFVLLKRYHRSSFQSSVYFLCESFPDANFMEPETSIPESISFRNSVYFFIIFPCRI